MKYADPWDEIVRLEKQMDLELQLQRTRAAEAAGAQMTRRVRSDRELLVPPK